MFENYNRQRIETIELEKWKQEKQYEKQIQDLQNELSITTTSVNTFEINLIQI